MVEKLYLIEKNSLGKTPIVVYENPKKNEVVAQLPRPLIKLGALFLIDQKPCQ
jgi:hypothetical protein